MAKRPLHLNATVKSRSALKVEDPRAQKLKYEQAHSLLPRVFSQGSERKVHSDNESQPHDFAWAACHIV